jgi:hypothetical protein
LDANRKRENGKFYAVALVTANDVEETKWEKLFERLHHDFKKVICRVVFIDLLDSFDFDDNLIWVCPPRGLLS